MKKTTNLEIYELLLKMQNSIGNDLHSMKDDIKTLDKKIDTVEHNLNQKIDDTKTELTNSFDKKLDYTKTELIQILDSKLKEAKNDIAIQVSDEVFDIYNEISNTNTKIDHLITFAKTRGYASVHEEDTKYEV